MDGKVVVVTGAGSGMGKSMVEEFVAAGARVVALDINETKAKEVVAALDPKDRAIAVGADVSSEESVNAAVAQALDWAGRIDVLCNNAGIIDSFRPAHEISTDEWHRNIAVNLTGPFLMSRAVIPDMLGRSQGIIINTASISSFSAAGGGPAYTAAKHGVLCLTRQLTFDYGKLGIRAGNTGLINLDDVPVPAENRIGEEGEGFLIAMSAIDHGRYTVAAGAVGLAQACLDSSVRYAHERETFGDEIGKHQLVKQLIAKMAAGIEAGRLLVWRAGWLKNQGLRNTRETSLAKWHATDHSVQAALDAIQIHGASGYSNEFPVERYLRNSKAAVIYEGTSQLHTLIQADYALGYREDRALRCEPWPAQGYERA